MSAPQVSKINLLEEAESWTDDQIEERKQELLDFIHPVVLNKTSEYELRLDCVRVMTDKLARFVPVYEAEDNVFYPILNGVGEFLTQVFESVCRDEEENCVMLLSVATALIDHTDSLLLQCSRYEGLGPGEVPSIPRLIPKILASTFGYCSKEKALTSSDSVKSAFEGLFIRCRLLLENFSALIDRLKIRSVLEDELDILLELCTDLVAFHKILFSVDLKSSLNVWKLFGKLAKEHGNRLRDKFDMESALLVLLREAQDTSVKLETALRECKEDVTKKVNRMVIALTFLVKIIMNLAEEYRNCVTQDLDVVSNFLQFMFLKGENIFPFMNPQVKEKMTKDLFSNDMPSLLLTIPDTEKFVEYILTAPIDKKSAFPHLQMAMALIETDSLIKELKIDLLDVVFKCFDECEEENQRSDWLEGLEVPGVQITRVGCYELNLTRVSRFICLLSPLHFQTVEVQLFKHLIGGSTLTQQLCADILCFISRYGTAELCLSHLELLSSLYLEMDQARFSTAGLWIGTLVGRLFNFLGPAERDRWTERFTPVDSANLPLWTRVSLKVYKNKETVDLVKDVAIGHMQTILDNEQSKNFNVVMLTNVLTILNELVKASPDPRYTDLVLTVWERLDNFKFVLYSAYWMVELITALGRLTVAVFPSLGKDEMKFIISCLKTLIVSTKGDLPLLLSTVIPLLHTISNLETFSRIESVDSQLLTEIGSLSSVALRTAVRNPVLRFPGLSFLKNLAQKSNNPGFIRLCSDESDVMPHFTLFLKENDYESRKLSEIKIEFEQSAPHLEKLINASEETEEQSDNIKRRLTSGTANSPRKKRSRPEVGEDASPSSAEDVLTGLEKNAEALVSLNLSLTNQDKERINNVISTLSQLSGEQK